MTVIELMAGRIEIGCGPSVETGRMVWTVELHQFGKTRCMHVAYSPAEAEQLAHSYRLPVARRREPLPPISALTEACREGQPLDVKLQRLRTATVAAFQEAPLRRRQHILRGAYLNAISVYHWHAKRPFKEAMRLAHRLRRSIEAEVMLM